VYKESIAAADFTFAKSETCDIHTHEGDSIVLCDEPRCGFLCFQGTLPVPNKESGARLMRGLDNAG
jgi:hypothetical protein